MRKKIVFLFISILIFLLFFSINVKADSKTELFNEDSTTSVKVTNGKNKSTYHSGTHLAVEVYSGTYIRIPLKDEIELDKITDNGNPTTMIERDVCWIFFRNEYVDGSIHPKTYMYVVGGSPYFSTWGHYNQEFQYKGNKILVEVQVTEATLKSHRVEGEEISNKSSPARTVYKKSDNSKYSYYITGDIITHEVKWWSDEEYAMSYIFSDPSAADKKYYDLYYDFKTPVSRYDKGWRWYVYAANKFWASSKDKKFYVYFRLNEKIQSADTIKFKIEGDVPYIEPRIWGAPVQETKYVYKSREIDAYPSRDGKSELPTFSQTEIKTDIDLKLVPGTSMSIPIYGWNNVAYNEADNNIITNKGQTSKIQIGPTIDYTESNSKIRITSEKNVYQEEDQVNIKTVYGCEDYLNIIIPDNIAEGDYNIEVKYIVSLLNRKEEEEEYYIKLKFNININNNNLNADIEDGELIYVDPDTGEMITAEEANEKYEESKLDTMVSATQGTNGPSTQYKENLNTLISKIDKDEFEIDMQAGQSTIELISKAISYVQFIGIALSAVLITILGWRYIMGSTSQKADYKENLVTFVIGAGILLLGTAIVKFILVIASNWHITNL